MKACVILHNLILDYEESNGLDGNNINDSIFTPEHPFAVQSCDQNRILATEDKIVEYSKVRDPAMHDQLTSDLVEHMWNWTGRQDS